MNDPLDRSETPVSLAQRRAFSEPFRTLFDEGMALVDEAAGYLDSQGRAEAKQLSKVAATLYAAESMRLTTRLMQVASWLLLQRAVNEGEMSREQVEAEKVKVTLDNLAVASDSPQYGELPETFRSLLDRALHLERRVALLDRELYGKAVHGAAAGHNPVGERIDLLRTALNG